MKDWTGNKASTWSTLAANNHSDVERETHDFYATDPHALQIFLDKIKEDNIKLNSMKYCTRFYTNQVWT